MAKKDKSSTRMPLTEAKPVPQKTIDPEFSCYRPGGMAADEARLSVENPQYTAPTPNPSQDKLKRGWGPNAKINVKNPDNNAGTAQEVDNDE